jgi:arylsulfatase A-like enzyme
LIARLPGVVPAGVQNSVLCNLLDLGPTAVEITGGAALPAPDGHSLLKELRGERDSGRADTTFSELGPNRGDPPSRLIRQGPWKLYQYHDDTAPALFNLQEDPAELNDLGTDAAHALVRQNLLDRLYTDWDPERVARRCAELSRDMQVLTAWGQAVQPCHPDTLPVQDVEEVMRC